MSGFQIATASGSMPSEMVAVESKQEQPTAKLYNVPVIADIQMSLTGDVKVYATSEDDAKDKVQAKIDERTLDDDLEMEDAWSGKVMTYDDVTDCEIVDFGIDESGITAHEADEEDMLRAEVDDLQRMISWEIETLSKQKAFLESLIEPKSAAA